MHATLRAVSAADAPFLHLLMNDPQVRTALGEGVTSLVDWQGAIATWQQDPDEKNFIIADPEAGAAAGWLGLNGLASRERVAWVKMLALLPPFWGRGYASDALASAKAWLAAQGYGGVRLWTDAANARALTCYVRNGFVAEPTELAVAGSRNAPRERVRMVADLRNRHGG